MRFEHCGLGDTAPLFAGLVLNCKSNFLGSFVIEFTATSTYACPRLSVALWSGG